MKTHSTDIKVMMEVFKRTEIEGRKITLDEIVYMLPGGLSPAEAKKVVYKLIANMQLRMKIHDTNNTYACPFRSYELTVSETHWKLIYDIFKEEGYKLKKY
jgi:hypothetical protein